MTKALAILSMLAYAASAAAEGVVISARYSDGTADETREIRFDGTHVRIDYGGEIPKSAIFDAAKQVLWVIDPTAGTYVEVTKADVDRLRSELTSILSKARAELNGLPEAQRARVMRALQTLGISRDLSLEKTVYKRAGSARVKDWPCDVYEGFMGAHKISEVCSVSPQSLRLQAAHFAAIEGVARFMSALSPAAAEQPFIVGVLGPPGFGTVSLKTVSIVLGRRTSLEMTQVQLGDIPLSMFQLPAGLTPQPLPNFAP